MDPNANFDNMAGAWFAGMGVFILVCILVMIVVSIIPFWVITKRLGWEPFWSLLMIVPLGNLIWAYYVAFAKWPIDQQRSAPPSYPTGPV
jgi:hypothetical protein